MPTDLFQSMMDPAILFFVLGVLVGDVRSNLEILPALAKFLSLYFALAGCMALGITGRVLRSTGLPHDLRQALRDQPTRLLRNGIRRETPKVAIRERNLRQVTSAPLLGRRLFKER